MSSFSSLIIFTLALFSSANAKYYQGDVTCDEESNACLGREIECSGCTVTCSGRTNSCNGAKISGAADVICSGDINSCLGAEITNVDSIRCLGKSNSCVSATLSASTIQCVPKTNTCMGASRSIVKWRPNQKRHSEQLREESERPGYDNSNYDSSSTTTGSGAFKSETSYKEESESTGYNDVKRRSRNFESMNNDLDGLATTIDKVRTANKLILDHVMTQDNAIDNLESQRMNVAQNLRHVYAAVDELERDLTTKQAESTSYQRTISSQSAEMETYSSQIDSMSAKIQKLATQAGTLEKNLEESQQNYSDLRYENNKLLDKIKDLEGMEKELKRKEDLLDWAQRELVDAQRKDSELRKSFSEIQAVLGNRDRFDARTHTKPDL